jgi:hypothetical protein
MPAFLFISTVYEDDRHRPNSIMTFTPTARMIGINRKGWGYVPFFVNGTDRRSVNRAVPYLSGGRDTGAVIGKNTLSCLLFGSDANILLYRKLSVGHSFVMDGLVGFWKG